jgi:predicted DNA-binding transcriptional regulator AlpA
MSPQAVDPNRRRRADVLPCSLPPRGLRREEAAAYVGVSPTLFDEMVVDRRMPPPRIINNRRVWDRHELDASFEALPHKDEPADDDEWRAAL